MQLYFVINMAFSFGSPKFDLDSVYMFLASEEVRSANALVPAIENKMIF